jgi:hypothetical protein
MDFVANKDNYAELLELIAARKFTYSGLIFAENVDISELHVQNLYLEKLDVSKLVDLQVLDCTYNCLRHLDVRTCTKLRMLLCANNYLTSLLLHSASYLDCANNQLTSLQVIDYSRTYYLHIENNQISELVLPSAPIYTLNCSDNQLSKLDLSKLYWINNLTAIHNNLQEIEFHPDIHINTLLCNTKLLIVNNRQAQHIKSINRFWATIAIKIK